MIQIYFCLAFDYFIFLLESLLMIFFYTRPSRDLENFFSLIKAYFLLHVYTIMFIHVLL